jgi:hypothetical protein
MWQLINSLQCFDEHGGITSLYDGYAWYPCSLYPLQWLIYCQSKLMLTPWSHPEFLLVCSVTFVDGWLP